MALGARNPDGFLGLIVYQQSGPGEDADLHAAAQYKMGQSCIPFPACHGANELIFPAAG